MIIEKSCGNEKGSCPIFRDLPFSFFDFLPKKLDTPLKLCYNRTVYECDINFFKKGM